MHNYPRPNTRLACSEESRLRLESKGPSAPIRGRRDADGEFAVHLVRRLAVPHCPSLDHCPKAIPAVTQGPRIVRVPVRVGQVDLEPTSFSTYSLSAGGRLSGRTFVQLARVSGGRACRAGIQTPPAGDGRQGTVQSCCRDTVTSYECRALTGTPVRRS